MADLAPVLPHDKWVRVNGLSIHYLDWGGDLTKKPLFLLHGLGGNAHSFDDVAPRFLDTHHVIAVDERGCGESDWSRQGYAPQQYASDVAEMALRLGLYPFDYYGASQGSRIGQPLGAYWGHLIDHLVLGDYGAFPDPSPAGRETAETRKARAATPPRGFFNPRMAFDWHREQDSNASDEEVWEAVEHGLRTNFDGIYVRRTDPEVFWTNGRTGMKEGMFMKSCWPRVSCKTLVLRGEVSTVLDRAQAEEMAATIPNAVFREVPRAGHGLLRDNPDDAVRIVQEFFAT